MVVVVAVVDDVIVLGVIVVDEQIVKETLHLRKLSKFSLLAKFQFCTESEIG